MLGDIIKETVLKKPSVINQHLVGLQLREELIDIVDKVAETLDERNTISQEALEIVHIEVAGDIIVDRQY